MALPMAGMKISHLISKASLNQVASYRRSKCACLCTAMLKQCYSIKVPAFCEVSCTANFSSRRRTLVNFVKLSGNRVCIPSTSSSTWASIYVSKFSNSAFNLKDNTVQSTDASKSEGSILSQFPGGVPQPPPGESGGTGSENKPNDAGASPESDQSNDKKKEGKWTGTNIWKLGLVVLSGCGIINIGTLIYLWGEPRRDENGQMLIDRFSDMPALKQYLYRAWDEAMDYKKMIEEPSRPKLLPDPLQEPYYQPPYTLVIELTGVLVHPDWTYKTGWRFKKRPGVEYFLQKVGPPNFEVVIFTQEQGFTAFPIIDTLDQKGCVMYRLFRDATRYMDGHHVKDLACLNRDLSKVIFVDWNAKSYKLQPDNAFPMTKWSGDDEDRKLVDLANFLSVVAASGVSDVREVLRHYSQFDDPLEAFKENQRKLQEQQEQLQQQQQEQQKSGLGLRRSLFSWK